MQLYQEKVKQDEDEAAARLAAQEEQLRQLRTQLAAAQAERGRLVDGGGRGGKGLR